MMQKSSERKCPDHPTVEFGTFSSLPGHCAGFPPQDEHRQFASFNLRQRGSASRVWSSSSIADQQTTAMVPVQRAAVWLWGADVGASVRILVSASYSRQPTRRSQTDGATTGASSGGRACANCVEASG